jgi:restriction endonuclease
MIEEVKKYRDFVENAIKEINNKYNTVVFTTIDEILKGEIDTNSIWWSLSKINDSSYKRRKVIEKKLNSLSEEDYDEWGYEIQDEVDSLHSLCYDTSRVIG